MYEHVSDIYVCIYIYMYIHVGKEREICKQSEGNVMKPTGENKLPITFRKLPEFVYDLLTLQTELQCCHLHKMVKLTAFYLSWGGG